MHKILAWVKEHPKTAAGILAGLVVLLIFSLRSGSKNTGTSAVVVAQPTDVGQNTALQEAMLNAQVATNATLAQAGVQNNAIAASQALGTVQSNNATQVALTNIATTADTTKYVSTLQAQVANNQTDAAKSINDAQMTAATQIATINANANNAVAAIAQAMNTDNNRTTLALSTDALQGHLNDNATAISLNGQNNATQQMANTLNAQTSQYGEQLAAETAQWNITQSNATQQYGLWQNSNVQLAQISSNERKFADAYAGQFNLALAGKTVPGLTLAA